MEADRILTIDHLKTLLVKKGNDSKVQIKGFT